MFADMADGSEEGDSNMETDGSEEGDSNRETDGSEEGDSNRERQLRLCSTSTSSGYMRATIERTFEAPRVKAYLLSGRQVCLPGVGEGSNFGTFPSNYGIRHMLDTTGWVIVLRTPEDGEIPKEGVHYELVEPIPWKPASILFQIPGREAEPAVRADWAGRYGARSLRVIAGVKVTPKYEDKPSDDVSQVKTPPTPSAASDSD